MSAGICVISLIASEERIFTGTFSTCALFFTDGADVGDEVGLIKIVAVAVIIGRAVGV